ncbi:hypothetical protein QR685DRAFT_448370, partial [Neurospora intermedia]
FCFYYICIRKSCLECRHGKGRQNTPVYIRGWKSDNEKGFVLELSKTEEEKRKPGQPTVNTQEGSAGEWARSRTRIPHS